MSDKELLELSYNVPHHLSTVKYVHGYLKPEQQNEETIYDILNKSAATNLDVDVYLATYCVGPLVLKVMFANQKIDSNCMKALQGALTRVEK